jgi:hypothetical protein
MRFSGAVLGFGASARRRRRLHRDGGERIAEGVVGVTGSPENVEPEIADMGPEERGHQIDNLPRAPRRISR